MYTVVKTRLARHMYIDNGPGLAGFPPVAACLICCISPHKLVRLV
jgi:hypothetical protein